MESTSVQAASRHIFFLSHLIASRILPQVPFYRIASIILPMWRQQVQALVQLPAPTGQLARDLDDSDTIIKNLSFDPGHTDALAISLAALLEEKYEEALEKGGEIWQDALGRNVRDVQMIITQCDLGEGFDILHPHEAALQCKWIKENDWKAGSLPIGSPITTNFAISQVGAVGQRVKHDMKRFQSRCEPVTSREYAARRTRQWVATLARTQQKTADSHGSKLAVGSSLQKSPVPKATRQLMLERVSFPDIPDWEKLQGIATL